jgi:PadR family transcriptional regulator PadR
MAFRSDLEALVLAVLEQGDSYGYQIAKSLRAGSRQLAFKENQLYPKLHVLEANGLVESSWISQNGKPARKVYRITERGRASLVEKRTEWESFTKAVDKILTTSPISEPTRA